MENGYKPTSEFLNAVAADEVPLGGSEMSAANFQKLIAMTRDDDVSNRDWATMLLSQQEVDTPEVRDALLRAANDEVADVRAEAIEGLAQRDHDLALPFIQRALSGNEASLPIFEAAKLVAHPSLVDDLRAFVDRKSDSWLDDTISEALDACEAAARKK